MHLAQLRDPDYVVNWFHDEYSGELVAETPTTAHILQEVAKELGYENTSDYLSWMDPPHEGSRSVKQRILALDVA